METRKKKMAENNLKEILDCIADLKSTMNDLKVSVEHSMEASKQATQLAQDNKGRIEAMQTELNQEKLVNAKLSIKLDMACERIVKMEAQSRRDNLLFDGIEECDPNEDSTSTLRNILKQKLNITNAFEIPIVRCHRLGPKREETTRPRTIIVKFQWYADRMAIWNQRRLLKSTKIYMDEDFPQEIQERRRILTPVMKKARDMGKKAFLNVDILNVEGEKYSVKDTHRLPSELSPANVATPQVSEDAVAFFGAQSPLSNFYTTPLVVEGTKYDCVERFYQREKAHFHSDQLAGIAIMRANTALDCYKIGHALDQKRAADDGTRRWRQGKAAEVMLKGLEAKFSQNTYLKNFLLATEDKRIIEANPRDKYWSCGLSLRDSRIASEEHWTGENTLGTLLMRVRGGLV
jgi:ribA/ribD-fused uncharacterized protein